MLFASIITRILLHLSVIIENWSIVWGTKYSVTWKRFIAALFLKICENKMLGNVMSAWLQSSYKGRRPEDFYQGKPEGTNGSFLNRKMFLLLSLPSDRFFQLPPSTHTVPWHSEGFLHCPQHYVHSTMSDCTLLWGHESKSPALCQVVKAIVK